MKFGLKKTICRALVIVLGSILAVDTIDTLRNTLQVVKHQICTTDSHDGANAHGMLFGSVEIAFEEHFSHIARGLGSGS